MACLRWLRLCTTAGVPDIIVRLDEGSVILEIELEPALTVEADALSRLGMEIDGQPVQNVFAVTVPERLRSTSQRHLFERIAGVTLVWQEWRIDGTSGPKLSGTAIEFGNAVQRTSPPAGDLDEAVDVLDEGARRAGSRLYSSPGTLGRVSDIFGTEPSDESGQHGRTGYHSTRWSSRRGWLVTKWPSSQ